MNVERRQGVYFEVDHFYYLSIITHVGYVVYGFRILFVLVRTFYFPN